jgi:hypothetical protein
MFEKFCLVLALAILAIYFLIFVIHSVTRALGTLQVSKAPANDPAVGAVSPAQSSLTASRFARLCSPISESARRALVQPLAPHRRDCGEPGSRKCSEAQ